MKYYVIAGEASGDLHGSHLLRHLMKIDNSAEVRAWGGDLMEAEGAHLVKHVKDLAFMGWWEVLMNIRTISSNFLYCKKDVVDWKPDVIVMIDFPGFNLKLVKWFHERGYKIIYYISPQVWAWKAKRVEKIKKYVDRLMVILPFEEEYYRQRGVEVDYVGHPLLDHIDEVHTSSKEENLVAILPGSRQQEIENMLPIMLTVARKYPDLQFEIGQAPTISLDFYTRFLASNDSNISIHTQGSYDLMSRAPYAMVTSGTATLETALHGAVQVVCYKGGRISFEIAKRLVQVKYISLVNLILDTPLLRELIQHEFTVDSLNEAFDQIRTTQETQRIKNGYRKLRTLLGDGKASETAAHIIYQLTSDFAKS